MLICRIIEKLLNLVLICIKKKPIEEDTVTTEEPGSPTNQDSPHTLKDLNQKNGILEHEH